MRPIQDQIILVTGATGGIGKQTALEIAKLGARVVIVGRNADKTRAAVDEIKAASGNDKVEHLLADLSSIRAVRGLASEVLAKYPRLDVLINNAGAVNMSREVTVDGYERTFATNHLAYFLLTELLVPALEKADGARVINVSSDAHRTARMNLDDLMAERGYISWYQYGRSKLANLYFTREAARRYAGKKITVNAVHPGFVASDFLSKGGVWKLFKPIGYLFAIDIPEGAKTSVYLATSPEVEGQTGLYFHKCKPKKPWRVVEDEDVGRKLWEASEAYCARVA